LLGTRWESRLGASLLLLKSKQLWVSTKQSESIVDVLVEVVLVGHKHDQVDSVLINNHTGDLRSKLLTQNAVNRWVNGITNHLSALT